MADKRVPPYFRCDYTPADAAAMQALSRGDASEAQQRRVVDWLFREGARIGDLSWVPESDRASSFMEGRRFVGLQVAKLIKMVRNNQGEQG